MPWWLGKRMSYRNCSCANLSIYLTILIPYCHVTRRDYRQWLSIFDYKANDYKNNRSKCQIVDTYVRGCPRFKNSIFILRRPHKRCLMISPSKEIFWFCSKFDHKLLGTNTSLVQAVLSLVASRTRSCPRSLSLTLLKKKSKM